MGFALFNAPPASFFLGDVGSLPLGLMTACLLITVAASGHIFAALLLPLYHLCDATITLFRRALRGERLWRAHREHFYQKAVDGGLSVLRVDAWILALNAALILLALLSVMHAGKAWVGVGCLLIGLALTTSLLRHFTGIGRRRPAKP